MHELDIVVKKLIFFVHTYINLAIKTKKKHVPYFFVGFVFIIIFFSQQGFNLQKLDCIYICTNYMHNFCKKSMIMQFN